jgi:hypothetical protein
MIYDRTLIQIRERSFLDLLDLSLHVIRAKPVVLGTTALLGIAPWAALNLWLLSDPSFPPLGWMAILMLEVPWATAPLTLVLGALMFGRPVKPSRMARTLFESLPALILSQLMVRGLLLVFVVVMPSRLPFLNEVILLERESNPRERKGVFAQIARARRLTRGFEGDFFVRWLAQLFLGTTFSLCLMMSAQTLASTLIGNELTWYQPGMGDMNGLLFQTAVWIAVAFFGVYRFFSYIDQRIRLEGWELNVRLTAVARALEARPGS